MRQIRVYPVAEGELFLQSDRMRGPLARRFRDPSQRFQILLFRDHLLERGSQFVRLQLLAKFLELLERQSTLVLRPLFVVVLLDHLPHLVSGHLEAADVQRASQLRKVDETVPILVNLTKIKPLQIIFSPSEDGDWREVISRCLKDFFLGSSKPLDADDGFDI